MQRVRRKVGQPWLRG